MIKKTLCVILALFSLLCCLTPASAQREMGKISVKLRSDIAGVTEEETEKLIELKSDNVVFSYESGTPVSFYDYAGSVYNEPAVAGRKYGVDYLLEAAEGFTLPEKIEAGDLDIECDSGVRVISASIVSARKRDADGDFYTFTGLRITAEILADGNLFERIAGFFYDIYLKIRAWSLY